MNLLHKYTALALLSALAVSACGGNEVSNDSTHPEILEILLPENSVFFIGESNLYTAHFRDDVALSNFLVRIFNEKSSLGRTDSLYLYYTKTWSDTFGKQDATVEHYVIIPQLQQDTATLASGQQRESYPIIKGKYLLETVCIDQAGNRAADTCEIFIDENAAE